MSFNFSFVACDQIISNAIKMHYMSGNRFLFRSFFEAPMALQHKFLPSTPIVWKPFMEISPGLIIIAPSNPYDAKGLLKSAIRNNNPVLFLEVSSPMATRWRSDRGIPRSHRKGKSGTGGKHVTLCFAQPNGQLCVAGARELAKKGITVELIDLRTIKPLDIATVAASVRKTHRCVLVEEGHIFAGITAEVGFQIIEHCFDISMLLSNVLPNERPLCLTQRL